MKFSAITRTFRAFFLAGVLISVMAGPAAAIRCELPPNCVCSCITTNTGCYCICLCR